MVEFQLYNTVLLLAAGINLLIAVVLLYNNYWYRNYEEYHRARLLAACCYASFGVAFGIHALMPPSIWYLVGAVLSVAYFCVSLFTLALVRFSLTEGRHVAYAAGCAVVTFAGLSLVVAYPTSLWPYMVLTAAAIVVFAYIFYVLTEHASLLDADR